MRSLAITTAPFPYPTLQSLELHCLHSGLLISTPRLYLLATFHHHTEPLESILDLARQPCRLTSPPDMVHIWLAAGDLRGAPPLLLLLPDSVGFISYERFTRPGHRLVPIHKFKFPH